MCEPLIEPYEDRLIYVYLYNAHEQSAEYADCGGMFQLAEDGKFMIMLATETLTDGIDEAVETFAHELTHAEQNDHGPEFDACYEALMETLLSAAQERLNE